ncbi:MAG: hypothetical protein U0798_10565 [Gemmataceae bacterium]
MLRFGSLCTFAILLGMLSATQFIRAEDPPKPRYNLDEPLHPIQTVSSLSARLKLLTGDLDPSLLKNIAEQLKNNPKMSPDEMLKMLGKEGGGKGFEDILAALKKDPSAFESLKNYAEKMGQGGLTVDQLKDWFKEFGKGMKAPEISGPNITGGNLDPSKFKFDGKFPDFKPGQFELPDGSSKFMKDLVSGWEKNVGAIGDNPALKNSLESLLKNTNGFQTGDLKNWLGDKGFDFSAMKGLFGKNDLKLKLEVPEGPKNVKLPDMNLPSFGGAPSLPSAPSFGNWSLPGFGGFSGGGASAAIPILVIIAIIAAIALAWWMWPQIQAARQAREQAGKLPLPPDFDPRDVRDRPSLVRAFEMLSLVVCGNDAKVWNHATIATALREYLQREPDGIDRLAVMYALARYTPKGEELHPDSVREARRTLCRLAGVPEA